SSRMKCSARSAAALGVSAEQITQDWSRTNYSSARAAMLESWKTLSRRSADFKVGTATPIYACWLQEAMEGGQLDDVLPRNAPDYIEAATEYSRLRLARCWTGIRGRHQGGRRRGDAHGWWPFDASR
ncbi:hypothetical protein BZM27_54645, partial [Paraburkholderia steynii]